MKEGPLKVVTAVSTFVSVRVLATELPQLLTACTLTLPLVKSDGFTATVMLLVVDVPVNPVGRTQL